VEHILDAIVKTPVATILVVAGIIFWLLAIGGSLAGKITVKPQGQKIAAILGTVFLGIGLTLQFVPSKDGAPRIPSKDEAPLTPDKHSDTQVCPGLRPRGRERPSVSCAHAQEPIERLICADADLAHWDREMGRIYHEKLDQQKSAEDKENLRKQQREWLHGRDDQCDIPDSGDVSACQLAGKKDCVLRLIKDRVDKLSSH
jgi:uncharacterized protein YecT (DUF1311 family)